MNTNETERSLTEIAEDAAELAARALACGLARMIDTYVPKRLATQFATRVAVLLLREMHVRFGVEPPVVFRA